MCRDRVPENSVAHLRVSPISAILEGYGKPVWSGGHASVSPLAIQSRCHPFPASGYRNNSSGILNNVGSNGYYWAATPYSTSNGRNINFNSSSTNWNNNNRANGFPVRAVAEAFSGRRLHYTLIFT